MNACKAGKGVDRHLFVLRMLFEREQQLNQNNDLEGVLRVNGFDELQIDTSQYPEIFSDVGYKKSGTWRISTSHCGSASLCLFGFGPVVSDGFGIGYMIKNNSICFNVTSKYTSPFNSSTIFASFLASALLHMKAILLANPDELRKPSKSLEFSHPTSSVMQHHMLSWAVGDENARLTRTESSSLFKS